MSEEQKPVSLMSVIEQLREELPLPAEFRLEITQPLPVLKANPIHLRQIFQNLISNAVQHHDRGDGTLWIGAEETDDAWRLEVADDGPGIPVEARYRVFQMFNTTSPQGHTGIGLAVVRKLALSYGAQVEVTENHPRGSLFRITWPKQTTYTPSAARQTADAAAGGDPDSGPHAA